jgi:hypothetical protein
MEEMDMSKSDNDVTVEVVAPRSTDSKKFTWPKSTSVGAAADEAAKAFGYEAGTPTFQTKDKLDLSRKKTLAEAGISDLDQLTLTDTGGGV